MNEIHRQFAAKDLVYACVSTELSHSTMTYRPVYMQIILKRKVNKKGWFLDKITGDQCNYHVTQHDQAWNEYIKKGDVDSAAFISRSKTIISRRPFH